VQQYAQYYTVNHTEGLSCLVEFFCCRIQSNEVFLSTCHFVIALNSSRLKINLTLVDILIRLLQSVLISHTRLILLSIRRPLLFLIWTESIILSLNEAPLLSYLKFLLQLHGTEKNRRCTFPFYPPLQPMAPPHGTAYGEQLFPLAF